MEKYKRLTIRDEFGNADIFGVDSELLYNELTFTEANALTKAFNRLAELEDKIENGTLIDTTNICYEKEEGKDKIIEEMAKDIRPVLKNRVDIGFIPDLDKPIAKALVKQGYRKIPKDSVVLSREELSKRDYKFRQIGYDECVRDNPKKDKHIETLERKINQLNTRFDQARKEVVKELLMACEKYEDVFQGRFALFLAWMRTHFGVEIKGEE